MKILFGATPVPGHVLPLLPFADAAADAGHDVAFLTAASMAPFLGRRKLLAAGPDFDRILAVNEPRAGSSHELGGAAAELFAGTRVDLTWEEALEQAQRHRPDLLVGEWVDFVTIGGPLPVEFADALHERANWQHAFRFLKPRGRIALLDPFPDSLRLPTDTAPESDRITIRPGVPAGRSTSPIPKRAANVPRALVTMATLLATLAAGLPTVLFPVLADQPLNAARAALRIDDATTAGVAARRVLDEPGFRQAATEVATETAAMNSPAQALAELEM